MTNRFGGGLAIAAALAGMLAVEWVGLPAGRMGVILIATVIGLALVMIIVNGDLQRAGIFATCAAAFTLTWNGWFVGPVRPGDLLIPIALICFVVAAPNNAFRTPPWWVKQLAFAIILVAVLAILVPTNPGYLAHRVVLDATGQPAVSTKGSIAFATLGVAIKFVIAVAAIPLAFTGAALVDRRAVRWLAVSFVTGAAASGAAAFLDFLGASVSGLVTRLPNLHGRQLGFSNHPNFLAAGLVLGVPFACWLLTSRRTRDRLLGAACLPSLVLGVYASGSRGGAVCVVATLAVAFALLPRTRAYFPGIALAGAVAGGAVVAFVPAFGAAILRVTRLGGDIGTAGSDTVRAMVGRQGVADFRHSPINGIGLHVSFEASQVYLQELASGGLILFGAMSIYMLGGMWSAFKLMPDHDLAAALLAALVATLSLNIFEADLTDRFYYVPAAILVALLLTHDRAVGATEPVEQLEPETV
ncbi:MAG: hypothetical protein DLM58_14745 [Pseudonocardiales bacterium]|nr:MAG: hypothetical protein DLM58_14745 [Pseudonocardiales bacterium]